MRLKAMATLLACIFVQGTPSFASGDDEHKFDSIQQKVASLVSIAQCSFPTFSPDGKTVAFVSNMSGSEQIWTVPITGGWPNQLTNAEALVGAIWSPTEAKIAFMAGTGTRQLYVVNSDGTGLKQLAGGDNQISNWSADGKRLYYSTNPGGKKIMPYVADTATGESKPLLAGFEGNEILFADEASADGRSVLATLWKSNDDSQLYVVNLASQKRYLLTDDKVKAIYSGGGINRSVPSFAAAPNQFLCVTNYRRDKNAFARITTKLEGGLFENPELYVFPERPGQCTGFCLSRDRSIAATVWSDTTGDSISLIKLKTNGEIELPPPLPASNSAEIELSPDGNLLAISLIGATSPQDIWIYNIKERRYDQLTHSPHPGVNLQELVEPQLVKYKSRDGEEISARLYEPIITNPRKSFVVSCSSSSSRIDPEIQALLAMGIGVITPKIREPIIGDTKKLISGEALKTEVDDLKATVEFLTSKNIADAHHIGIMGFSHGGAVTFVGLTHCPELFAAGLVHAGCVDYVTYLKDSNPTRRATFEPKIENEEDKLKALRNLSAINLVEQVKAPIMVQQGTNDAQVPASQSDELVQALKKHGTPVEYIQFTDEGHWLHKLENRVKSATELTKFFDAKLNHS